MKKYKLYAGLSGGFGGQQYQGTYEFKNEHDAQMAAYELAVEEYQAYEGNNGIMSWGDCEEDVWESGWVTEDMNEDAIEELIQDRYNEEIEYWIEFDAILVNSDSDEEEEE